MSGKSLVIPNGYSLVRDQFLTNPVEIVGSEIRVKTGIDGLLATNSLDSLVGSVDLSFDGFTNLLYLDQSGDAIIRFNEINPEGFALNANYPASILVREAGQTSWVALSEVSDNSVDLVTTPNTDWEYKVRVPGYEWTEITTVNAGDYGLIVNLNLNATKDLSGVNMFSKVVDEAIVSTFTYDFVNNQVNQANTTGALLQVPFTEAYVGMQRIEHDPALVAQLEDRLGVNAERNGFTLTSDSTAVFKLTDNSNENVQLLFNIVEVVGEDKILQIGRFIPATNGKYILMSSEVVSFSATFPTESGTAAAVKTALESDFTAVNDNVDALPTLAEMESSKLTVQDSVYIDTNAETNGNGSFISPFNVVADALDYLQNNHVPNLVICSDMSFDREVNKINISGHGYPVLQIANGDSDFSGCVINNCKLDGSFHEITANNCKILDGCNLWGDYNNCTLDGSWSCAGSQYVRFNGCGDATNQDVPPFDSINLTAIPDDFILTINNYHGSLILTNCNNATARISFHTTGGRIVLGSSLDEGRVNLYGNYTLINSMPVNTNVVLTEESKVASSDSVDAVKEDTAAIKLRVDNLPQG